MKLAALFEAPAWNNATTDGYLAVLDTEGNWTPEVVYAFSATAKSSAEACRDALSRTYKDSDTIVSKKRVEGVFIVFAFDFKANMDDVHFLAFGTDREDVKGRVEQEVEDGDRNVDKDMLDDMVLTHVQKSGKVD